MKPKTQLITPSQIIPWKNNNLWSLPNHPSFFFLIALGIPSPRPTFSSALVSDYDTFAQKNDDQIMSINYTPHPKATPYFHLYTSNLFYIEHHHKHLTNLVHLAKANFPTNLHFGPVHPAKTLTYYRGYT